MRIDVVTIFPRMLDGVATAGVIGRACERGLIEIQVHDLRDFADPPNRQVDDVVYGGGAGMLFRAEPLQRAIRALRRPGARVAIVMPSPRGEQFSQPLAREFGDYQQLLILCDRYEGSDGRVRSLLTHEVSLGDFVLTGGEVAAMAIIDATVRLQPGVVGRNESIERESFTDGLLDHDSYTRPEIYAGAEVPAVLRTGHHENIRRWRLHNALRHTLERRPDLLGRVPLAATTSELLANERRGGES